MADLLRLTGMTFYGYHGVTAEERRLGQRFVVDLELAVDLAPAAQADDLALTVDYRPIYERLRALVEGPPCRLLETLAERVAAVALAAHPAVQAVVATVHKPGAPIPGAATLDVSVRVERRRGAAP
jgi:dihydroneopterin aldolase